MINANAGGLARVTLADKMSDKNKATKKWLLAQVSALVEREASAEDEVEALRGDLASARVRIRRLENGAADTDRRMLAIETRPAGPNYEAAEADGEAELGGREIGGAQLEAERKVRELERKVALLESNDEYCRDSIALLRDQLAAMTAVRAGEAFLAGQRVAVSDPRPAAPPPDEGTGDPRPSLSRLAASPWGLECEAMTLAQPALLAIARASVMLAGAGCTCARAPRRRASAT